MRTPLGVSSFPVQVPFPAPERVKLKFENKWVVYSCYRSHTCHFPIANDGSRIRKNIVYVKKQAKYVKIVSLSISTSIITYELSILVKPSYSRVPTAFALESCSRHCEDVFRRIEVSDVSRVIGVGRPFSRVSGLPVEQSTCFPHCRAESDGRV